MSYEILESVRLCLVTNLDSKRYELAALQENCEVDSKYLIGDKVFPEDVKLAERISAGALPAIAFSMNSENEDSCGRISGIIVLTIMLRDLNKKVLWEIHRAIQKCVTKPTRLLQAAAVTSGFAVRIGAFDQLSEDDSIYDPATDTYRLRSRWNVKYVNVQTVWET